MSGKPLKLSGGNCSQLRPPVNLHLERKLFYSIVLKHKSPQMFGNVNIQIKRVLSSNNVNNVLLFSQAPVDFRLDHYIIVLVKVSNLNVALAA